MKMKTRPAILDGEPVEIICEPIWYKLTLVRWEDGEEGFVSSDKLEEE